MCIIATATANLFYCYDMLHLYTRPYYIGKQAINSDDLNMLSDTHHFVAVLSHDLNDESDHTIPFSVVSFSLYNVN